MQTDSSAFPEIVLRGWHDKFEMISPQVAVCAFFGNGNNAYCMLW